MYELELKQLFTKEEYNSFLEFMLNNDYFWLGKENSYCLAMYIQEFLMTLEDNERKEKILEILVNDYSQILGMIKENI